MQTDRGLGHAVRLAYLDSITDVVELSKTYGAPDSVQCNVNSAEVYMKRALKTASKMMRLQCTIDFDIDTLFQRYIGLHYMSCYKWLRTTCRVSRE